MNYIVSPLVGMGDLKFGMGLEDVRAKMSGKFRTFDDPTNRDGVYWKSVMDAYDDQGIYCLYSPEDELEAISLFSPARPFLEGADMLALRMSEAIAMLKKIDPALAIDSGNAVSARFSLGISESTEAEEDEDGLVYRFFFGRAGFYT